VAAHPKPKLLNHPNSKDGGVQQDRYAPCPFVDLYDAPSSPHNALSFPSTSHTAEITKGKGANWIEEKMD